MNEKLRLKAIENQMRMDFSPLMIKYGIYDQLDLREFISKVSINTPKHETVKEWETRNGESYPDDAPVWGSSTNIIESPNNKIEWKLELWANRKPWEWDSPKSSIVANHHGKPEIEG